jgi:hypothetical protein
LEWNGTGPNVEVSIKQGSKVLAKVQAHMVELQTPAARTATEVSTGTGAIGTVTGFRFEGKKYALELADTSANMESGSK